jgi:hypothetical protein
VNTRADQSTEVPEPAADTWPPTAGLGSIVPYITAWSGEQPLPTQVIERPGAGIAFADETLADRDLDGVLWTRTPSRPGLGRPEFGRVHPLRQRRAMRRLLCQVCGQPADRNDQDVLWLLKDHREDWPNWPENMANTYPPVCLPCAHTSIRACPALRRGCVAVRAKSSPVCGVFGVLYETGQPVPQSVKDVVIAYSNPAIRWTRAAQLVRSLQDCTIVDIKAPISWVE